MPTLLAGRRFHCLCCDGHFRRLLAFGTPRRRNAKCPRCGSLERHRLLHLYFTTRPELLQSARNVLHIAPEAALASLFQPATTTRYVSFDRICGWTSACGELESLPFADGTFDAVICNHVLEHVADDHSAMKELRRVLRPDGWALLQTPIDAEHSTTIEDPSVTDPAERVRLFGQIDHVRRYGTDFEGRVAAAGFSVQFERFGDDLSNGERDALAVLPLTVHLCRR